LDSTPQPLRLRHHDHHALNQSPDMSPHDPHADRGEARHNG
jgi:hypothetical protein